ncbi:MAG: NAD-dependent epimerase/dehydratase family protein [Hyphomonadaceae bacterium]
MRVIVTGGCGFAGAAVVRSLVERGDQVLAIDRARKSRKIPALAPAEGKPGFVRLEADVSDARLMRAYFREFRPDHVIHLAAPIGSESDDLYAAGPQAAFGVAEACADHLSRLDEERRAAFRLVHTLCLKPQADDAPPSPDAAMANAAADFLDAWCAARGVATALCAAPDLFGPYAAPGNLIGDLLDGLLGKGEAGLPAFGDTVREWLPVRDFASGLIDAALLGAPGGRYGFSVGVERSDRAIAEAVCGRLDIRSPRADGPWIARVDYGAGEPERGDPALIDPTGAEETLQWRPHGFHAGLEATINWALRRHPQARAQAQALPRAAE